MSIALIVFDIAGTTVKDDNRVAEAFREAMEMHGYDCSLEQINPYMGYEKNQAIRAILQGSQGGGDLANDHLIAAIHKEFVSRMIAYYEKADDIVALPNVERTFADLKSKGVKVALNTGFSRDIADVIIKKLGWEARGLVDCVIASDEVTQGRPHPDMIRQLMAQMGIANPLAVAKVGDTEVDINEGLNAGCKYVIGVTTGAYTREELAKYHPTHIIDDIAEVITIIAS